jgi:hypothetical protein
MSADDRHVYPLNDLQEHITDGPGCPCNPRIDLVGATLVYIHNSFDHREIAEEAIRILNGEEGESDG